MRLSTSLIESVAIRRNNIPRSSPYFSPSAFAWCGDAGDLEPQPSAYAKMVWRALEARRKVNGRTADWIVVRNRLESVASSNQHQITQVLDVIQRTVVFGLRAVCWSGPYIASFSPPD